VQWEKVDMKAYLGQTKESSGFWMSFHELVAGYPWLTKRAARVMDTTARMPGRNPLAYLLAIFVPYAGRLGAGFGVLIMVYLVGVLAAVALPAYQDYQTRAKVSEAVSLSQPARLALARYYEEKQGLPESLEAAEAPAELPGGIALRLEPEGMVLTVAMPKGEIVFTPQVDDDGHVNWQCTAGEGLTDKHLPASCQ